MAFAATSSTSTTSTWFATGAAGKQKGRCEHLAMLLKGVFGYDTSVLFLIMIKAELLRLRSHISWMRG